MPDPAIKKRIAIFGSTGSIGTQALEVIKTNPTLFEAEILTAQTKDELLIKQALEFNPNAVVIGDEKKYEKVNRLTTYFRKPQYASKTSVARLALMARANDGRISDGEAGNRQYSCHEQILPTRHFADIWSSHVLVVMGLTRHL